MKDMAHTESLHLSAHPPLGEISDHHQDDWATDDSLRCGILKHKKQLIPSSSYPER